MSRDGMRHLCSDPAFAALIRRVGPPRLDIQRQRSPYEALIRAIAHQQLHGRAAEAILARFVAVYPAGLFPAPEQVLATDDAALRGCGFSAGKIAALRDICRRTLDGTVPTRRASTRLSDAALIERLVAIRGVGRWTVEMLLIFTLGSLVQMAWPDCTSGPDAVSGAAARGSGGKAGLEQAISVRFHNILQSRHD